MYRRAVSRNNIITTDKVVQLIFSTSLTLARSSWRQLYDVATEKVLINSKNKFTNQC